MSRYPYGLTRPHSTKRAALTDWDSAGAGRNTRPVAAKHRGRWYAFDRAAWETDYETRERLAEYLEK